MARTRVRDFGEEARRGASFLTEGAALPTRADEMDFNARSDFITVGTFLHKPNVDSVRWLCEEVWPLRARAVAEGDYARAARTTRWPPSAATTVSQTKDGISRRRIRRGFSGRRCARRATLLAPLRFGAGIKGKVLDAWTYGLPYARRAIGLGGYAARASMSFGRRKAMRSIQSTGGVDSVIASRRVIWLTPPCDFTRTRHCGNAPGRRHRQ